MEFHLMDANTPLNVELRAFIESHFKCTIMTFKLIFRHLGSVLVSVTKPSRQTLTPHFGARVLVQCARACGGFIYYINAHLPHAREFSAYARECITRKLSVASGPDKEITPNGLTTKVGKQDRYQLMPSGPAFPPIK